MMLMALLNSSFTEASVGFLAMKGAKIMSRAIDGSKAYESFEVSKRVKRQFIAETWSTLLPGSKVLFIEDIKKDDRLSKLMIQAFKNGLIYHDFKFGCTYSVFFVVDGSIKLSQLIPYAVVYPPSAIRSYGNGDWLRFPFWQKFMRAVSKDKDMEGEYSASFLRGAGIKVEYLAPIIKAALTKKR